MLFILVDALRADHLGVYGYPHKITPNIDKLAERSLFYTNAYSNATWTVPSVASLFTGTLPVVHRISRPPGKRNAFSVLADDYILPSEVFKSNGYVTGMITAIGWVSKTANYAQGVDEFIRSPRNDLVLSGQARDFITKHRNERFHLYLHLIDLHDYYHPDKIFSAGSEGRIDASSNLLALKSLDAEESYRILKNDLGRPGKLSPRDIDFLQAAYDRGLRVTDGIVGLLVRHLAAEGLLEDTLIVITGDHGEQFMEHGSLMHAGESFYNDVLHIPLIISDRGRFERRHVITAPVSSIDIYPSLFHLAGIRKPDLLQGESIVDDGQADRAVFATSGVTWKVITKRWSYIVGRSSGREELYDLRVDPGEKHDLSELAAYEQVRAAMRGRLQDEMRKCFAHAYLSLVKNPPAVEMTDEERAVLKSLGYIH
ncbi:MAG: sulfatase [Acidobacteriota bacterium]